MRFAGRQVTLQAQRSSLSNRALPATRFCPRYSYIRIELCQPPFSTHDTEHNRASLLLISLASLQTRLDVNTSFTGANGQPKREAGKEDTEELLPQTLLQGLQAGKRKLKPSDASQCNICPLYLCVIDALCVCNRGAIIIEVICNRGVLQNTPWQCNVDKTNCWASKIGSVKSVASKLDNALANSSAKM